MKNFKKFTAFVLALCMLFSLSISAFAAEKTPTGYLTWALDDSGTLSISGNGRIAAFTSADDQPWHEMRENITSVKFDPGAHMIVPDVAFWFSGCTNLKSCVLPSFANLGADAFKDCANLNRLQLHYNDESFYISDTAFSGVDMSALEIVTCDEVTMGILDAKGITFVAAYPVLMISSGACGVSGCNCSSCSFTYDYEQKDESKHYVWECCTNCSANEYAYRHTQSIRRGMDVIGKKFAGTAAKSLTGARPTARILMVTGNITRPASIDAMALVTTAVAVENINTVATAQARNTMSIMKRNIQSKNIAASAIPASAPALRRTIL